MVYEMIPHKGSPNNANISYVLFTWIIKKDLDTCLVTIRNNHKFPKDRVVHGTLYKWPISAKKTWGLSKVVCLPLGFPLLTPPVVLAILRT